jgi:proton-dependent oligopeptide transporter, POT family
MKFNHPKSLPFLFLTEMWERFGFYIVQGLLILYMTEYFAFSDKKSYSILGVYTALVYISPIIGGILADKLLGFPTAIIWGGFLLVTGYFMLAIPHVDHLFFPALATIVVGNGLFKPNISSILGSQYSASSPKRDAGFTIFYMGINLGILFSGLSSGFIKNEFGWRICYATAGAGLVLGLFTFYYGLRYVKRIALPTQQTFSLHLKLFIALVATIVIVNMIMSRPDLANWLLPIAGIALIIFLTYLTLKQTDQYRNNLIILNILNLASVVFWMIYFQMFFSANLFIERLVDKRWFGIPLTTTVFYASVSIYIILFGPIFAYVWQMLSKKNMNPSPIVKFCAGIFLVGIGFLVLGFSTHFPDRHGLINANWVFLSYLSITLGELFLSPIGLSSVTTLSPIRLTGFMMGVWFVSLGFGGMFAGHIAKLADIPSNVQTAAEKLVIYQHAFYNFAYMAFFFTLLLLLVNRLYKLYNNGQSQIRS